MRAQHNGSLSQAITLLIQNQAAFVAQLGETQKHRLDLELRIARIERSLAEIKAVLVRQQRTLAEHSRILADHSRILAQLPEAVRQQIGFKPRS